MRLSTIFDNLAVGCFFGATIGQAYCRSRAYLLRALDIPRCLKLSSADIRNVH